MNNVTRLAARSHDPAVLDEPAHHPGDIVLVMDGDREYYARIVARTWSGAYVVDPIRADAEARAAATRLAA